MIWMHHVECKPVSMQIMMKWSDKNDNLHVNEWSIQTMMNHTEWSEIIKVTYASGKWYVWETCARTRRRQMGAIICIPSPQRVQRLRTSWGSNGSLCLPDDACDWTNESHAAAMYSMNIDFFFVMLEWACSSSLPSSEEQDEITMRPIWDRRGAVFRVLCISQRSSL